MSAGRSTRSTPRNACKPADFHPVLRVVSAGFAVVSGRAPEVRAHGIVQQLHAVIADGHKPLAAAENVLETLTLYSDVAVHCHQFRRGSGEPGGSIVVPYLPKGSFIARWDARQHSPLHSGNGHAGKPCLRQSERERDVLRPARLAVCSQHGAALRLAVDRGGKHKVVGAQVSKEVPVFNHGFGVGQGDFQRCVGCLDCIHLGGVAAVGQHKAVHAEFPVGGAVAEVAAVGKAGHNLRNNRA